MAEATDVEEDNPRKLRTPNSRSCVDLSLSPHDQIFDTFFLHEKGDRETVRLLMRGTAHIKFVVVGVRARAETPRNAVCGSRCDRGARARVRDRRARIYVP